MASDNVLATAITLGTISSGVLAYLKSAKWSPWFNKHSAKLNHAFMIVTAGAGALGIHAVWDSAAHSLLITGLSLKTVAVGLWEWAKQFCVQYLTHRGMFGPVSIPGDAPAVPSTPVAPVPEAEAKP